MSCYDCGGKTSQTVATKGMPYHFTRSGLKNVYLGGITVEACKNCGTKYPVIPHMEELHKEIARALASNSGQLSGPEIRFLRKIAGFPQNKFASLLRIDPATLSRVENDRQTLGPSSDKLARAVAMAAINGEAAKEVLIGLAEEMQHRRRAKLPLFLYDREWKAAA